MIRAALLALAVMTASAAGASEPAGLDQALSGLAAAGKFSGAVVIRGVDGILFSRAYGPADPFSGRPFTPDTAVDSGSLAKPVTAAAVLALAADGGIDLDAPAQRYLPELPYRDISVRQLLNHSAGLPFEEAATQLAGKSNLQLVQAARGKPLLFPAGSSFSYCNLCTIALAEIVERVSGASYLDFARRHVGLPTGVGRRPARLSEWQGRAIGYRRGASGKIERFDSWEGERFYGAANLSISATQLAEWGSRWWQPQLVQLVPAATADAHIAGRVSGLTLGNWYCARGKRRCHYLGHHEGFHHMLYWDRDRKLSVAMVSNNAMAPGLVQRVQRSIVAFAEGRPEEGQKELVMPISGGTPARGKYRLAGGEVVEIRNAENRLSVLRSGVAYPAYAIGFGVRYVPGLDAYVVGRKPNVIRLVTLYEDLSGRRI